MDYCPDLFRYSRRKSDVVRIGQLLMGGNEPVRIQSMTNTSTMDTEGSTEQCIRIIRAGADLVRLTAQGEREAANLANIHKTLHQKGYQTPLVADIHFNPKAADEAALHVEKVRINPGNYIDPVKTFRHFDYTDVEYEQELKKIRDRFIPFLNRCRENHTAIRIGVNHGSLSDRIMSRYGDTPSGMVESCMEFLRICVEVHFTDVVISIKASNTLVMVQTVRWLVARMDVEGMHFPLHLGVTEAGDGEDGRIKSAVGIGTLLLDGIGDTIRISLSEDPEQEIPVARLLLSLVALRTCGKSVKATASSLFDPFQYKRRETSPVGPFGGGQVPVVLTDASRNDVKFQSTTLRPDMIYTGSRKLSVSSIPVLYNVSCYNAQQGTYPVGKVAEMDALLHTDASMVFLRITFADLNEDVLKRIKSCNKLILLLESKNTMLAELRAIFHTLVNAECKTPAVLCASGVYTDPEEMRLGLSLDFGPLLLDGFGDGVMYLQQQKLLAACREESVTNLLFGILQATRLRMSKTEFISCPGCGRTLFDLQQTIARIKARTAHLKGLKIGIMGCIVNGPGEMADADYGYVGAGRNRISLYKGRTCLERNIPEKEAVDKLIDLIKLNGDWKEPSIPV